MTTVNGFNGAIYDVQIASLSGAAGTSWDLLNVAGTITNLTAGIINTNFVISMDSMGQTFAGYTKNSAYSLLIATFTSAIYSNNFTLNTNSFLGAGSGVGNWQLVVNGNNLYLQQAGTLPTGSNFVWTNSTSAVWTNATAWLGLTAPPTNGGTAVVLQFNGSGATAYGATNNLAAGGWFTNNAIIFNSTATVTNALTGGVITFAGSGNAAGFYQNASGGFIVSNSVNLATNIVFDGAGLGAMILASNITGSGQITKQGGGYNTVLLGSNSFVGPVLVNSSGTLTLGHLYALGTNSITVSNGTVLASLPGESYIVGNGVSSQAVTLVGSGALWTNAADFVIGSGSATTGAVVTVNGGSLRLAGLLVGSNSASFSSLLVSNGGSVTETGAATIGSGGSSNSVTVAAGSLWNLGNNVLTVGNGSNQLTINRSSVTNVNGFTVGNFSSLLITNGGQLWSISNVGFTGTSNSFTVVGGGSGAPASVLNYGGGYVQGNGLGTLFRIDGAGVTGGAIVTNAALFAVNSGLGDSLIITNGGELFIGPNVSQIGGAAGASNNSFLVVGGVATSMLVFAGADSFYIGNGANTTNNTLRIDGMGVNGSASAVNLGNILVGTGTAAKNNSIIITNGGQLSSFNATTIGGNGNQLIVAGGGVNVTSVWSYTANGTLTVGTGASTGNVVRIDGAGNLGGAIMTNVSAITIGTNGAVNSQLIVTNGGELFAGPVTVGYGSGSSGNVYVVNGGVAGAMASNTLITIGSGGSGYNQMFVSNATVGLDRWQRHVQQHGDRAGWRAVDVEFPRWHAASRHRHGPHGGHRQCVPSDRCDSRADQPRRPEFLRCQQQLGAEQPESCADH